MSPRVQPTSHAAELELAHATRERFERANRTPLETAYKYEPGVANCFYRDLTLRAERKQRRRDSSLHPIMRGRDGGDGGRLPSPVEPLDLDVVEARLARAERHAREFARAQFDLASSGSAGALIPTAQLPPNLAQIWETAARGRSTLAEALGTLPVPEGTGLTVNVPRLSTGTGAAVQAAEGDAVTESDAVFALAESPLAYVAGVQDIPRQLLDRAGVDTASTIDTWITSDLAAAASSRLDEEILSGAGSGGHALGLLNVSGITSTTYTDASPTPAELLSKIGSCYSATATADGRAPDLLVMHPRRAAWLFSQTASADNPRRLLDALGLRVVIAPGVPTLLGASTSEDRVILLRSSAVEVFTDAEITAHPGGAASGKLQVQFRARLRVACVCKAPTAVGVISGTGLASPTFA